MGIHIRSSAYQDGLTTAICDSLETKEFVDVTLAVEDLEIGAHRLILSAVSDYFRQIFTRKSSNHPAYVYLEGMAQETLKDVLTFIYCGQIRIEDADLESFYDAAKRLRLKGLESNGNKDDIKKNRSHSEVKEEAEDDSQNAMHSTTSNSFLNLRKIDNRRPSFKKEKVDYREDITSDTDESDVDYPVLKKRRRRQSVPRTQRGETSSDKGYDSIADLRPGSRGVLSLWHEGHRYQKHQLYADSRAWRWTSYLKTGCLGRVYTKDFDGVTKMKVIRGHNHD